MRGLSHNFNLISLFTYLIAFFGTLELTKIVFGTSLITISFFISRKTKFHFDHSAQLILLLASGASLGVSCFSDFSEPSLFYSLIICITLTFLQAKVDQLKIITQALQLFTLYFLHFKDLSYFHLFILCLSVPWFHLCISFLYGSLHKSLNSPWAIKHACITCLVGSCLFIISPRFNHEEVEFIYNDESPLKTQASHSLLSNQENDHISLKGIEKLKVMQEPVFTFSYKFFEEPDTLGPYLYFKKQSYDLYDHGTWKTNITDPTLIVDEDDGNSDQWIQLLPPQAQQVSMEMTITPILPVTSYFGIGEIIAIQTNQLFIRGNDNYSQLDQNQSTPYTFKSFFKLPFGNPYPATGQVMPRDNCQVVPTQLKPILKQMFQSDQPLFSLVLLKKIESHLKNTFRYSLNTKGNGEEPLVDLIVNKQGWCVHFATAMTLLARYHGYPARVVSGLCIETPQAYPFETTARLSHSHAWSEVYIEPIGWTIWDATPESGLRNQTNSSIAQIAEQENALLSFLEFITRRINKQQTGIENHLFFIGLTTLFLLTYLIYPLFIKQKPKAKSPYLSTQTTLFDPAELKGIWQEMNSFLPNSLQIKSHESIPQHINRIESQFPDIDLTRISKLHNSVLWGQLNLSEVQQNWLMIEFEKIKSLISQTSR